MKPFVKLQATKGYQLCGISTGIPTTICHSSKKEEVFINIDIFITIFISVVKGITK